MAGLFEIHSIHGTRLCYERSNGEVLSASTESFLPSVLIYIPTCAARIAFLLTDDLDSVQLSISGNAGKYHIVPVRLQSDKGLDEVFICHHLSGAYLSSFPIQPHTVAGVVTFDRAEAGDSERFRLVQADLMGDYPGLHSTLVEIQHHAAYPLNGPSILARLEAGIDPVKAPAFAAVARLLPRDQFDWLGPTILGRPVALEKLAEAFPVDVFARIALPELKLWLDSRSHQASIELGKDWDFLAKVGIDGAYVSFPHMCNAHARRSVPPRREIAILATARNEGLYLLEWIAYHRSIGVQDIVIYSNDNNDGSDDLLRALADGEAIRWVRSEVGGGNAAQPKAYGHALAMSPQLLDSRWTLIIDLDEFFAFDSNRFRTISDYVAFQETRPVDAITLNWLVYGSSGELAWRQTPMLNRFVHRFPWIDPHVKTLVRSNLPLQSRPHYPAFDLRQRILARNGSGAPYTSLNDPALAAHPEANTAWINHYFLKSADEFIWKFSRNRGDYAMSAKLDPSLIEDQFAEMFVNQHTSQAVIHDDRILGCAVGMPEEMERLMHLPRVAAAEGRVREEYRKVVERLKKALSREIHASSVDSPRQRFIKMVLTG